MSLFNMLKKGSLREFATATVATVATVHPSVTPSVASVASVNVANPRKHAANDVAHSLENSGDSTTQESVQVSTINGTVIDIGTIRPVGMTPKLLAASLALDASIVAAGAIPGNGPDANCWPNSMAMTGTEIDLFTARLHLLTDKGLTRADGEALADKLVIRDRETDDRRSCLECRHLSGYGHTSWRCGNWQAAGIAIRPRDSQLPADLVLQLQRCEGFTPQLPSTPQGKDDDHAQH